LTLPILFTTIGNSYFVEGIETPGGGWQVLLTGASGLLGAYLLRELHGNSDPVTAWSGSYHGTLFAIPVKPVDLSSSDQVVQRLDEAKPDCILHTAALARISDCEQNPQRARQVNADGTALLAEQAGKRGIRLLCVSTDLVFDGEHAPYRETDEPRPLSVYAQTKREAELAVLGKPNTVVVRVSLLFGPSLNGRPSFFDQQLAALRCGRPLTLFRDEWRTPLAIDTAARALLAIARSNITGLLHLGGPERMSRLEMGLRLANFSGLAPDSIVSTSRPTTGELRPRDVSLDSSRWRQQFPSAPWPCWEDALHRLVSS
jgi:dTDP-4-dehydrorhamnose reductase